jgi:hypothetical protein
MEYKLPLEEFAIWFLSFELKFLKRILNVRATTPIV